MLILLAIAAGIIAGTVTGLVPGVHINLVAAVLLGISPLLAEHIPLLYVGVIIICMSITHNFVDMVPAIFLGAPEDDTALGVLPGHRYLMRGNGLMAVKLTIIGGILGTLFVLLLFKPSIWLVTFLATTTKNYLFWIIAGFILFTFAKDKRWKLAILVFSLSGVVGTISLRLPLSEPLLPLLSGIFGVATLLYSIKEENRIPEQKNLPYTEYDTRKLWIGSLLGSIGAFFTALFPGISSAMAAALVSRVGKLGDHGFMILLGSLGSASFVLSLAAFLAITKARNGAMAVVTQLTEISSTETVMFLSVMLVATGLAAILTVILGRSAARWLPRLPYTKTCIVVILFIAAIVLFRTGLLGLVVLVTSTAVGMLPAILKTARAQAMGCLLLPLLIVLW